MTRRILPLGLLVVAAGYLWAAAGIPLDPWSLEETVNARTLPLVCGSLLALFAAGMAVRGVRVRAGVHRFGPLLGTVACVFGFIVAIPFAGLWPSLAGFLLAALATLGERRPAVLIGAPVGTALAGWSLVEVLLGVYIHPGEWWT